MRVSLVDASVANYRQRGFQEPDGLLRLHRRPAPLGLSRGAVGKASARSTAGVEVVVRHIELEKLGMSGEAGQ
jgi:hypothetical protein